MRLAKSKLIANRNAIQGCGAINLEASDCSTKGTVVSALD